MPAREPGGVATVVDYDAEDRTPQDNNGPETRAKAEQRVALGLAVAERTAEMNLLTSEPPDSWASTSSQSTGSSLVRFHHSFPGKKLKGLDRVLVSRAFELTHGSGDFSNVSFKIVVVPHIEGHVMGKGGSSFKHANGVGQIQVKCEDILRDASSGHLKFWIRVGNANIQPDQWEYRGPFNHDFKSCATANLPMGQEQWNFPQFVDSATGFFAIALEFECA